LKRFRIVMEGCQDWLTEALRRRRIAGWIVDYYLGVRLNLKGSVQGPVADRVLLWGLAGY
jgi:hypothetical protein